MATTEAKYTTELSVKWQSSVLYKQLSFNTEEEYNTFINEKLVPIAMKIIDNFCKHDFQYHTAETIELDGNGESVLFIDPPYVPILSVSEVTVDGVDITSSIKTYSTFIKYDVGSFSATLSTSKNVSVTLNYGYETVPADVAYVATEICANILLDMVKKRLLPDIVSRMVSSDNPQNLSPITANPKIFGSELQKILKPYRYMSGDVV